MKMTNKGEWHCIVVKFWVTKLFNTHPKQIRFNKFVIFLNWYQLVIEEEDFPLTNNQVINQNLELIT